MSTDQKAGEKFYQEILKEYQSAKADAEQAVNQRACTFADSKKPEDHATYMVAKARLATWDQALYAFTRRGGDLRRLDFPKS